MLNEIFTTGILIYSSIGIGLYLILIGYCIGLYLDGNKDIFKDNLLGDGINKRPTIKVESWRVLQI